MKKTGDCGESIDLKTKKSYQICFNLHFLPPSLLTLTLTLTLTLIHAHSLTFDNHRGLHLAIRFTPFLPYLHLVLNCIHSCSVLLITPLFISFTFHARFPRCYMHSILSGADIQCSFSP
ncbi:hypothetical protein BKA57DRAFT_468690 [Linnemannia elongata]|nr:hypothetical protein BKA57DRAFT_468690 [Linnemannia elongata]